MAEQDEPQPQGLHPQLGLWDAVSIIIGIVIGTSIFYTPSIINGHLSSPATVLLVWTLGGVLCLVGALCYAELASAYPRMGGDYVYLTRAFGPYIGFMFGWAQLAVIFTASIGMMAFVFGEYGLKVFGDLLGVTSESRSMWQVTMAFAAVATLVIINILGVVFGKTTQNILTMTKVLGLGGIAVAGLLYGQPSGAWADHAATEGTEASFGVALILVLYAYGGWNDAAFVAADMRDRRHIPATLLLGTAGVMVIYLIINVAYIQALGFQNTQGFNPTPIAARAMGQVGEWASNAISVLVMISALGAINGLLFAGSRVCAALGKEHSVFAALGRFNPQLGSPLFALLALALISMSMILAVGTKTGRDTINTGVFGAGIGSLWLDFPPWSLGDFEKQGVPKDVLEKLQALSKESFRSQEELTNAVKQQMPPEVFEKHGALLLGQKRGPIPWEKYFGGFDTLFAGTAPIFWTFFLLTGISIFVLRVKDAHVERPFKIPGYPVTPVIFCLMCLFGLFMALTYAKLVALIGLVPLVLGLPLYMVSRYQPTQESQPLQVSDQATD